MNSKAAFNHEVTRSDTRGRTKLREHAEPGAAVRRGTFHREQCGAAPFAANADPLTEPQETEEHGCPSRVGF
jgi:hypothetical protein